MTLMQWGLAGEIWIKEPPTLEQARWNSWPFRGATMKMGIFFRLIRSAINCMVKVFAGSARAKDRHIGVLIDRRIEDVHDNKGTVVLVDPQQDTVIITHLIGCKGITACRTACQQVALTRSYSFFSIATNGRADKNDLFLPKMAGAGVHVL